MSEKTAAEQAADSKKLTPEQEHNRIVGRLLCGEDPDSDTAGGEE